METGIWAAIFNNETIVIAPALGVGVMNPPQGAGFPPPGPHGQGNQPQARTPAGAYQMMYVPVVQYPGQQQQQQQQQWTPHGGGTVPMMMAQGQVMMAVPQGRWGAPCLLYTSDAADE